MRVFKSGSASVPSCDTRKLRVNSGQFATASEIRSPGPTFCSGKAGACCTIVCAAASNGRNRMSIACFMYFVIERRLGGKERGLKRTSDAGSERKPQLTELYRLIRHEHIAEEESSNRPHFCQPETPMYPQQNKDSYMQTVLS